MLRDGRGRRYPILAPHVAPTPRAVSIRPMDSLSQIVLGGAVAAAIAPAAHRRAALAAGAALGTLPDLDSVPMWFLGLDPVTNMTWHRGPSHSLLVLLPFAALLWWLFRRTGGRVAEAPRPWFWAITLALVTHPLLDAFTVYGTQLWWPLPPSPAMWSSVFIIDPLYTLPLLVACLVALWHGWRPLRQATPELGRFRQVLPMGSQEAVRPPWAVATLPAPAWRPARVRVQARVQPVRWRCAGAA